MSKKEGIEVEGVVIDFKVKLENQHEIIAHVSGKIRMNRIRILLGDKVTVVVSPYDLTRGRIVYRHK